MSIASIREPNVRPPGALSAAASRPAPASTSRASEAGPTSGASTPSAPSPFAVVLNGLGREVQHGESLVRSALGAASAAGNGSALSTLAPGDLIALQAGVYRYGEAVDLASRLIDRATSAVKTVLQGQ